MILYFSATGNSEYAAKKIAGLIDDKTVSLNEKIRAEDYSAVSSEKPFILVVPTYAWRIPRIISEWLKKTELKGSKKLYAVMTCGENNGNASAYISKLCTQKGLQFCGCLPIVMPDNYLVMFNSPDREKSEKIIKDAEKDILAAAEVIKSGKSFASTKITLTDRLYSGPVNGLFYGISVTAKPFYSTESCVSCGLCERVCPLGNISLKDGKPVWGNNCTHCMACICRCPQEAIEYGNKTKGKIRYRFPSDNR